MAPLHAGTPGPHAHAVTDATLGVVLGVLLVGVFLYLLRERARRSGP